jgi:hypothetical protein
MVDAAEYDAHHSSLLDVLDETVSVLRKSSEYEFWAKWLETDSERLRAGDSGAVAHILSAYGGAGSINEVRPDEKVIGLIEQIYNDAVWLRDRHASDATTEG